MSLAQKKLKFIGIVFLFLGIVLSTRFFLFNISSIKAQTNPITYYISPTGNDQNSGLVSANPLKTIQLAIDKAQAGDKLILLPGEYLQNFETKRSGVQNSPISISGTRDSVVKGDGSNSRIIQIFHDFITLEGFVVDGKTGANKLDYRDKLVYVQGTEMREGVNNLQIFNMNFKNAGGECLRLRYFAHDNEIAFNRFENCGVYDFVFNDGGKNGEAIYVGTSSNQWADGKNPTSDPDVSERNYIHHNFFNTKGNECIEFKEGSRNNYALNNVCTGQLDPDSGGIVSRGEANVIAFNTLSNNQGAGIRLGGNTVNGEIYGKDTLIVMNYLLDNAQGGIKIMTPDHGDMCQNQIFGSTQTFGTYASSYSPASDCEASTIQKVNQLLSSSTTPRANCVADINADNVVDITDFSLLQSNYGNSCSL